MVLQSSKMAILTLTTCPTAEDLLNLTKTISKALLKEESHQTSCELAEKMNCDQKTFSIIFIQWDLPKNWESGCLMSLAKHNKKIAFKLLLNISPAIKQHTVTNSTFCTELSREMRNGAYIYNMNQRKEWVAFGDMPKPRVKPDLHPRKTMI